MSATTKTVGKVSVVPKGTWVAGTSYSRLDVVSYEGSSYIAAQDAPAGVSLANTSYWQMIASIGSPAPSAEVAAAAISATESWLAANISNPTSPVIDSTLNITNAAAQAKKTGLMTAPYFSSIASYEVGDFVNYHGTLYKCNTAIPSGMAWNGIYWTATSIGNEVSDLKNDLDTLNQGGLVLEENFIAQEINDWLDNHPEATTTVEDNSITKVKLIESLRNNISNLETRPFNIETHIEVVGSIEDDILGDFGDLRGELSPQGIVYNSTTDRYVVCFARGWTTGVIVELDSSWSFVRGKDYNNLSNLGHFNDITYNENTNKYYVATSLGDGSILAIDADTLDFSSQITLGTSYTVDQISYDNVKDQYIIYSRSNIYSVSSNFETVIMLIENFDSLNNIIGDYPDSTTRYVQGSCIYNGRFVSLFWVLKEHSYAISRMVFLNEQNTGIDFVYALNNEDYLDECEGLYFKNDNIYLFAYKFSKFTITRITFFKNLGKTDGNERILVLRYHSTYTPNCIEDAHTNALNESIYAYWINFSTVHPTLGGDNGYLFGTKNGEDYGTQIFLSQVRFCKRVRMGETWGDWTSIVESSSTTVSLSLKNSAAIVIKHGDVGFIFSPQDFTSVPHGSTELGTLPVGFRPRVDLRFGIENAVGVMLTTGYFVNVATNGTISLYWDGEAIDSARNGSFFGVYPI